MKYQVSGHIVDLEFDGEEFTELVESLEQTHPESDLLAAFQEYREKEFAA
jgi:hypothetical protein